MKFCPHCKTSKDAACFAKARNLPRGLKSWCKECNNRASRERHTLDPKRYPANERAYRLRRRDKIKEMRQVRVDAAKAVVDAVRASGCSRCPETNPDCLDFHHVRGQKVDNVCHMVSSGCPISTLTAEVAKCDILCANCHRKETARLRREKECAT
jgi:hypothetical protein